MVKKIEIQAVPKKLIFLTITSFLLMLCLVTMGYSAETKGSDTGEIKNNVFNRYDREMGRVDEKGIIYNLYGRQLGSVDKDGIIYNISDLKIGNVKPDGKIMNQSGTELGSVNDKGEIFNKSGIKMGFVKDIADIKFTGGAARLIFLK